jgi:hypothetical protein
VAPTPPAIAVVDNNRQCTFYAHPPLETWVRGVDKHRSSLAFLSARALFAPPESGRPSNTITLNLLFSTVAARNNNASQAAASFALWPNHPRCDCRPYLWRCCGADLMATEQQKAVKTMEIELSMSCR